MIHIDDLREKELLIARYFCGKTSKDFTPEEVYDMWCNWFKRDFRLGKSPTFKMVNGELVYRNDSPTFKNAEELRKEYNHAFKNIYKWIRKSLKDKSHDTLYYTKALERERNRMYGKVIGYAKPLNFYVRMITSKCMVAEFKLIEYNNRRHTVISGSCDKMLRYMEELKNNG